MSFAGLHTWHKRRMEIGELMYCILELHVKKLTFIKIYFIYMQLWCGKVLLELITNYVLPGILVISR